MPWHIVSDHSGCPSGKPFAVVKDSDGSVAGCHVTRSDAEDQMKALYANEPNASSQPPEETTSITPGFMEEDDYSPELVLRMPGDPIPQPVIPPPATKVSQSVLQRESFQPAAVSAGATLLPTEDSGGSGMTAVEEVDLDGDQTEDLGGKPSKGTSADKRLRANKRKGASTPNSEDVDVTTLQKTDTTSESEVAPQWSGTLVVEGSPTGDGREFAKDSLSWVDPPMPLRWQKEGSHGGQNDVTVQVGLITKVWRDGNEIKGEGHFDLGGPKDDDAHEAFRRMGAGTCTGVSIDADDITNADIEYVFPESEGETEEDDVLFMLFAAPEKVIFHAARIRAATLCDIPAFTEASLHLLTAEESQEALSASVAVIDETDNETMGVVGSHSTGTSDASWDAGAVQKNIASPMDLDAVKGMYAWYDGTAVEDGKIPKSACKFPHHNSVGGAANLTACSAGIGALHGGRGGSTIPGGDRKGVYNHLAKHLRDGGQEPPPFQDLDVVIATGIPEWRPPAEWFDDPHLGQVMPIMVTDAGRVYGHAAQWGQCHLGYMNECVMPPFEDFHAYYRTGEQPLDNGDRATIGVITAGIEHANLRLGASAAKDHYENTDAMIAYVTTGNDKHGIWVAGAILPWAQESRVSALRASGQVSPDWRRIGGQLRMVGLLTVNVSGYQIKSPKARSLVASGQIQSLIVEGMMSVQTHGPSDEDLNKRALELIRDQLAARVHGTSGEV